MSVKKVALVSLVIVIGIGLVAYAQLDPPPNVVGALGQLDSSSDSGSEQVYLPLIASEGEAVTVSYDYVVVDTGQSSCYNDRSEISCPSESGSYYGQDAQYEGNTPRYVDNGDGTVTDLNTGLMWQQGYGGKMTWGEALSGAETFNLGGYDDWRLPTIKELYSLIDFSGVDPSGWNGNSSDLVPFIDTDYFEFEYGDESSGERIIDAQYWSSTEYVATTMGDRPTTFGVNFADGRIKGYPRTSPQGNEMVQFVRYVRGNPSYGANDFADNGDGTIADDATGLMWQQDDSGAGMTWGEALAYCENLSLAGYDDWRLPDAKELQSIVDYSRSPDTTNSAAIASLFDITSVTNEAGQRDYPYFWSSTTHANMVNGGNAAYVSFGRAMGYMNNVWDDVHGAGAQRSDPKSGDPSNWPTGNGPQGDAIHIYDYARCVRDVESVSSPGDGESGGVNLFAPLRSTNTYLMDDEGNMIYTWESEYTPGNSVYLLENGNLLRTGNTGSSSFDAGGAGGVVQEIAPDGTVVWEFVYDSDQYRLHHDIEPLPNGNVLMVAWELVTRAEAVAAGRDPDLLNEGELWADQLIEVDPTSGAIVWEWHVWDHLVQDHDPTKANYGGVADHPELIDVNYSTGARPGGADWTHINSVDYNGGLDQILVSVRNFSEIWVIDHDTATADAAGQAGDLLYRWGNPQAYDAGTMADQQLYVQHDAQWIPAGYPGAGNILVFNNGTGRTGGNYSTVDEIVPPVDGSGTYGSYGPSAPVWTYAAATPTDLYAERISGAQRLSNGNTLICDGVNGTFWEVTVSGDVVWTYDYGQSVFRVTRYESSYAGIPDLRIGLPTLEAEAGTGDLTEPRPVDGPLTESDPPQEAVEACSGLGESSACQFSAPRGAITGVCVA